MNITIEVFGKNMALCHTAQVTCSAVPRVGETMALPPQVAAWTQGLSSALVFEVEWGLSTPHLDATVRCQAWGADPSHRRLMLEEHGWLQPRD